MVPTDHETPMGSVPRVFRPICELLQTAIVAQICDSTILLFEQAPLALISLIPPITGVPGAQIGGPLCGEPACALRVGRAAARLDSEQFRSAQKNSGLPQGLAHRSVGG